MLNPIWIPALLTLILAILAIKEGKAYHSEWDFSGPVWISLRVAMILTVWAMYYLIMYLIK